MENVFLQADFRSEGVKNVKDGLKGNKIDIGK